MFKITIKISYAVYRKIRGTSCDVPRHCNYGYQVRHRFYYFALWLFAWFGATHLPFSFSTSLPSLTYWFGL